MRKLRGVRVRSVSLLAAALAAAALLAACGGGDDGTEDTAPVTPLDRAGFKKRANEICAETNKLIKDEGGGNVLAGHPSERQLHAVVDDVVIPQVQLQVDRLRTIPPPPGDEQTVNEVLDEAQRGIDRLRRNPEAIRGDRAFSEANRSAGDYGLADCAAESRGR